MVSSFFLTPALPNTCLPPNETLCPNAGCSSIYTCIPHPPQLMWISMSISISMHMPTCSSICSNIEDVMSMIYVSFQQSSFQPCHSLNLQMGALLQCCRRRSEPDPDQEGEIPPLSIASPQDTGAMPNGDDSMKQGRIRRRRFGVDTNSNPIALDN